jgi:hypothetical protein
MLVGRSAEKGVIANRYLSEAIPVKPTGMPRLNATPGVLFTYANAYRPATAVKRNDHVEG